MFRRAGRIPRWAWARRVTAIVFLAILVMAGRGWIHWFRGSMSGTALLEVVPFIDPLAAIEVTIATRALHVEMLVGAVIVLGATVLLGPVFCGWLCPLGLLADLVHSVRRAVLRRFGRRRVAALSGPVPEATRYAILGLVVGFAIFAQIPLFQVLSPINLLARSLIFGNMIGLTLIALIVAAELIWPRKWCRTLCPLGALLGLAGRYGVFRVRAHPHPSGRTPCGQCSRSCPMGIRVMEDYVLRGTPSVTDLRCIRCGECIDSCPRGVLRLGLMPIREAESGPPTDSCPHAGPERSRTGVNPPLSGSSPMMPTISRTK